MPAEPDLQVIVSVTSIELKSPWLFFRLSWHGLHISRQARAHPGFIRMKNTGFGRLHYTLSAWTSEEEMHRFVRTGAHQRAMRETAKLSRVLRTLTYASETFPSWKEAKRLLAESPDAHEVDFTRRFEPPPRT